MPDKASRRDAEDIVIAWLDGTVGVSVSEHIDRRQVSELISLLGWPAESSSADEDYRALAAAQDDEDVEHREAMLNRGHRRTTGP